MIPTYCMAMLWTHTFILIHTQINIPTVAELYSAFTLTTTALYEQNFSAYVKINNSKWNNIFSSTFYPVFPDSLVLHSIITISKGLLISTPIFSNCFPHNLNHVIAKWSYTQHLLFSTNHNFTTLLIRQTTNKRQSQTGSSHFIHFNTHLKCTLQRNVKCIQHKQ